ncbi:hypothetical protein [Nonomuraea sp. 3-1Str]|uniref:hypothetical protein n=1 Tax=Nonomuraea sp. 3-1Str TaxID=2929801 RepID=UPI00287001E4|nr:hypothetical protein [Nonomuraea sp. 3-1Str]
MKIFPEIVVIVSQASSRGFSALRRVIARSCGHWPMPAWSSGRPGPNASIVRTSSPPVAKLSRLWALTFHQAL